MGEGEGEKRNRRSANEVARGSSCQKRLLNRSGVRRRFPGDLLGWSSGRTGSGGENSNEFVGGGHEVRRCLEHLFGAFLFPEL